MSESDSATKPATVRFHYIKSPAFHTIHADGAIGAITPSANFHLALYAERFAIPTSSEHVLTPSGPGEEIREARVARDGVVRELLVDVVFEYKAAVGLRQWLDNNIKLWEQITKRLVEEAEKEAKEPPEKGP